MYLGRSRGDLWIAANRRCSRIRGLMGCRSVVKERGQDRLGRHDRVAVKSESSSVGKYVV